MTRRLIAILTVVAALATPALVRAQSLPPPPTGPVADPAENAKVRIGPFFLQPAFGLSNVGLDTNVFNDPENVQKDWTGTVSLGMLAGVRFGPTRLTVKTNTDYVYYAHFNDERSIDGVTRYQFEVRRPRLRPWIAYEKTKSHERYGFEIDERAGRNSGVYEAGVEYRVGFRLGTRFIGRQRKSAYQAEETFRGVTLSDTLDATFREGAVQLLYELSPLSSLRLSGEVTQNRFEKATRRNSEDRSAFIGIEGGKGAGIEGQVDVGWTQRTSDDPTAPSFDGLVARGSAALILWEQVRVAFGLDRGPQWAFEDFYSFYIQSGGSTEVTWRPHQRFDIIATGQHYWLDYNHALDERGVLRTDKVYSYGGGIGFFLQGYPGPRLGVSLERSARESIIEERRYDSLRYYTHVGFSF